jgi:asparagine synthase (glutamine-hydrolysing)
MCGINGIFAYGESAPPVDEAELLRTRDYMVLRGPDGAGHWISAGRRVGLAHRRLAIIDLTDAGAQPMWNAERTLCVTFNGEIYNYPALRKELESEGVVFRTASDTEVLLHLYASRGEAMVRALRGMFAFAIWDERRQGLFLARDPMGIKPLYVSNKRGTLRFASQVKALLKGGQIDAAQEPAGYLGFYLFGNVPEPYTLFREIRSIEPGTSVWIDGRGEREPSRYFDISTVFREAEESPEEIEEDELRTRLRYWLVDSVRHHRLADVPVGVFQSSGIDSSVLTALMTEQGANVRTVTLGFNEFQGTNADEVPLARMVANHYGTAHETVWIKRDDFRSDVDNVMHAMDQPSIDGINTYFVSKAAARCGLKVAISGLGGDELFAGYGSYREVPGLVSALFPFALIPGLGEGFRKLMAPLLRRITSPKYASLLEYGGSYGGAYFLRRALFMPWEIAREFGPEFVRQGWADLQPIRRLNQHVAGLRRNRSRIASLELCWYLRNQLLRDADWAGMAHSVEIRVPFVDSHLLKSMAPVLVSTHPPGKRALAAVVEKPLIERVVKRKKTGFVVPVREWLATRPDQRQAERGLRGWAREVAANWPRATVDQSLARRTAIVFRIGQLGDTLVSLPAIASIRARNPEDRLILLTDRHPGRGYVSAWDVLSATKWFTDVIFYEPREMGGLHAKAIGALISSLRDARPDVIYNLAPQRDRFQRLRDRVFFGSVLGIKEIHSPDNDLGTERSPDGRIKQVKPEWRRLASIIGDHVVESFKLDTLIPLKAGERAEFLLLEASKGKTARFVALAPGSKMPAKIWQEKRFIELGRWMLDHEPELRLLILGGAEDLPVGNRICAALGPRATNLAGRASIMEAAAILARCAAYVGNDTGTMHLASMVGIRCVVLFSARDYPGRWNPYGENHEVLRHEVDCAGCFLEICDKQGNKCMNMISVEEVRAAVSRVMTWRT